MSRRSLLHARLDRRIVEGTDPKTGVKFRYATPGSAEDFRRAQGIDCRPLPPRVIITGRDPQPNNPEWRKKFLDDPKKVRGCSGRHHRSLCRLAAVRRDGIPASLWVVKAGNDYQRIV